MILDDLVSHLNARSRILVLTPWMGTVGNCGEEVYFGLLKARREGKKVLLLFPRDLKGWFRFSRGKRNSALPRIESIFRIPRKVTMAVTALEWLVSVVYFAFRVCSQLVTLGGRVTGRRLRLREDYLIPTWGQQQLWVPAGARAFSREAASSCDWRQQMEAYLPVGLPAADERRAIELRERLGLPLTAPFVCLHVREGGMYGDYVEAYFRNATIGNYRQAIEAITDRGIWVVRLGDPTMTKLSAMIRVIDYAHSSQKCDLMDLYLIKECGLYIGSQSGIWDIAALFQKPLLMPNMCEWVFTYPQRIGDLGILKHVWSKSRQRLLSIQELLGESLRCQYLFGLDDDFVFVENTADEIRSLVEEYYGQQRPYRWSELQALFQTERVEEAYRLFDTTRLWEKLTDDDHNKFRIASRLEGCTGAISDTFLRANWNVSSRNVSCVDGVLRASAASAGRATG